MADSRYEALAEVLIGHSCRLAPGEKILIEAWDTPQAFVHALIRVAARHGGIPLVTQKSHATFRQLMLHTSPEQMQLIGETEAFRMSRVDAYVGIRGNPNISEWGDVPDGKMALYRSLYWKPTHLDLRVKHTKWVVLRWPSASMAQQARLSTSAFEDFFFDVCTMNYAKMSRALGPLRELMEATDKVRLVAPETDLRFSIRGIPAIGCDGQNNIPDGECFTAPVRDSVEGHIYFDAPTIYNGVSHEDVRLRFEQGKVVDATSSNSRHLNATLDSDEGARYVGEFAIGFNPLITQPMKDILFDEKIAGSIHFTPGAAYEEAWNGNRSEIHWDLVRRMNPESGGGEIWFDDRLIRKDGLFVLPELEPLNPENLLA